jgi:hypothetical protein
MRIKVENDIMICIHTSFLVAARRGSHDVIVNRIKRENACKKDHSLLGC